MKRGFSWYDSYNSITERYGVDTDERHEWLGFRVARTILAH
jgi:hypothetical protein